LRQPLASEDVANLIPLAVIGLNGEYFGIDLKIIREFSALRVLTPVPCCPQHIVGQLSLRGDILTLIDIRAALNMPLAGAGNGSSHVPTGKVVVVETDAFKVGVLVDDVFDVMNLHPSEIREVPSAVHSQTEEYLRGTAPCGEKMLSILDLPKILTHGALTVNEQV
jgi:purine-binding chemotaxis protein CheW